jgi:hypothetical protein
MPYTATLAGRDRRPPLVPCQPDELVTDGVGKALWPSDADLRS